MKNPLVTVEREDKVIGQFPPRELPALYDTGRIFDSDLCHSEERPEKVSVRRFLRAMEAQEHFHIPTRSDGHGSETRRKRQTEKFMAPLIAGWAAFLISLALLVASAVWIGSLYGELAKSSARYAELENKLGAKEKDYQRLLFVSREIAEPGLVRGSVILRNEGGKRVAMPGIQVHLHPRETVESHLSAKAEEISKMPDASNIDQAAFYASGLPNPVDSTTTDASGRFEFRVPSEGEYVLYTSISSPTSKGLATKLWFVSFNSRDPVNTAVDLGEANCVQQFIPSLMIVNGR